MSYNFFFPGTKSNKTMKLDPKVKEQFPFNKNDVVLAKYDNELFYAKIVLINYKHAYARCVFDDESKEDVPFQNIFDGKEYAY